MQAAGLAPVWLALPGGARAGEGAVEITYFTRVSQGEAPRLRLRAREPIGKLEVKLERDDGKPVTRAFAPVAEGESVEVSLPGEVGSHRFTGKVLVRQGGVAHESALSFEVVVAAPLELRIDKNRVDLVARTLVVQASRPPRTIALALFGSDGARLSEREQDVSGRAALEDVTVSWPAPAGGADIARIEVKVTDAHGFFAGAALYPWSVRIPHEEVNFATDSAEITRAEQPKLDDSLRRIGEALRKHGNLGPIKLFIAGHTDTQGTAAHNLQLSLARARAIAAYMRQRGLRIPVMYEGFGEHALLVATPDDTDEVKNRRVDYILAIEPPRLGATAFAASWKSLR